MSKQQSSTYTYVLQLADGKIAHTPMDRDDDEFVLRHLKGAKIKQKIKHEPEEYTPNLLTRCVNLVLGTEF